MEGSSNSFLRVIKKYTRSEFQVFLFLILSSILLRILSFFYSIIDHDESSYLIISNELNKGAELYKDLIDNKPPGIYIVFSFIQILFGKSVIAIRLFGAIIVGSSSFLLYRINTFLGLQRGYSLLSGFLFTVVFSLYRFGLVINTEVFFTFFTILGLYWMLLAHTRSKLSYWILGGFAVGIASIFKYVVLADFAAFALFFFLINTIKKSNVFPIVVKLVLSGISLLIPFALMNLYFFQIGNYEEFYHVTFEVVRNYPSTLNWADNGKFFFSFHLKYLPVLVFFYWALFHKKTSKDAKVLGFAWYTMVWIVVILPGKQFNHYYLQLIPVVCLLIPYSIQHLVSWKNIGVKKQSKAVLACSLLALGIAIGNQSYFWTSRDLAKEIADDLRPKINPDDIIFTDAKINLSYYLLDLKPPSKYVHPTIIFNHAEAFEISTEVEMNKILNQNPSFIIYRKGNAVFENHPTILNAYTLFNNYGKFTVLERVNS